MLRLSEYETDRVVTLGLRCVLAGLALHDSPFRPAGQVGLACGGPGLGFALLGLGVVRRRTDEMAVRSRAMDAGRLPRAFAHAGICILRLLSPQGNLVSGSRRTPQTLGLGSRSVHDRIGAHVRRVVETGPVRVFGSGLQLENFWAYQTGQKGTTRTASPSPDRDLRVARMGPYMRGVARCTH